LRWNPSIEDRAPIDLFIDGYESRGDTDTLPPVALQALALAWLRSPTRADQDQALRYATRAVELSGRWEAACLATLAAVQQERGETPAAVATLEEASGLPTFTARHEEQLQSYRAALYPRVGSLASAEAYLADPDRNGDMSVAPQPHGVAAELVSAYLEARNLQRAGSFGPAAAAFGSLARSHGNEPLLLLRAAECLETAGRAQEAEALFVEALRPRFDAHAARRERVAEVLELDTPARMLEWLERNAQQGDLRNADSLVRTTQPDRAQDFLLWKAAGQRPEWEAVWMAWWRLFASRCGTAGACLEELQFRTGQLNRSPVCMAETFEAVLRQLGGGEAIRIDAGARPWAGVRATWESDFADVYGGPSSTGRGSPSGAFLPYAGEIHGTDEDSAYRTLRTFSSGRPGGYRIPLPPGRYLVTVHLVEVMSKVKGARRFTILAEGEPLVEDFEPLAQGFATAFQASREVPVTDGWLEVAFQSIQGAPQVAALEVERLDD
jgi:tetratricopeptide (TPR) repeat protein